ncbi:MAG: hypothetical protein AAF903_08745 [Pseudomonadota bacterium]
MSRWTDLVLIAVAVGGAVWTYQTKHEAELSAKHLDSLRVQIAAQKHKIGLLEADWALATGPARLEKLAKRYEKQLGLAPMTSSQIADLSELPALRQERDDQNAPVYAGQDRSLTTGSISSIGGLLESVGALDE